MQMYDLSLSLSLSLSIYVIYIYIHMYTHHKEFHKHIPVDIYLSSMEASESLSIESFSYSWLVNLKPSFESPKGSFRFSFDESNFIEMDPKLSASKRFLVFHQDFDFDLPTLQPSAHADELISNGFLVPLFLKPSNAGSNSTPASPVSSCSAIQENVCSYRRSRSLSFRRYKRLPKRVVQKYLNLVRLIWLRMRRGRCDSGPTVTFSSESYSVDNWRKSCDSETTKIWGFVGPSSPRTSEAYGSDNWPRSCEVYAADNWRRSCDSENSIYEAVLHCKKTIGCK